MKYLSVRNWEKFQHYNDRNPPWIKLHRDLLRNYDFICLQDASKLHLMLIWLLASQLQNKIPADPNFIKSQIGVSGDIDFKELIDKGFLECDSDVLADCKQSAMLETETDTDITTVLTDNNLTNNKPMYQADIIAPKKKINPLKPDDVSEQVWEDFVKHRKAKRAPVTETVLKKIRSEAEKVCWSMDQVLAEMCARGWQGFNAEWINNQTKGNKNVQSSGQRLTRAERADIALGIVPGAGANEGMDGSIALPVAPVVRHLSDLRERAGGPAERT